MRPSRSLLPLVAGLAAVAACSPSPPRAPAANAAVADTLERLVRSAYDIAAPGDVVARLVSLYPDSGQVISATGGQVTTTRAQVVAGVRSFWESDGQNMRGPEWRWGPMHVDVLGPDAAVLTTSYLVPHRTPDGRPHVLGGAWTAVFARRGGRWVIIQEHLSDLPRGQAAAALEASGGPDSAGAHRH